VCKEANNSHSFTLHFSDSKPWKKKACSERVVCVNNPFGAGHFIELLNVVMLLPPGNNLHFAYKMEWLSIPVIIFDKTSKISAL